MNIKPGSQFDPNLFKNPPADCQVSYSWLWNVPVDKEGIDRGLREIKEAGVRSIYILPLPIDFRPELTRTFFDTPYPSPEYFELVRYALRQAVELGITPWLYDEGGWPSGSACGRTLINYPDALTILLGQREITLKPGERYTPCSGFIALFDGDIRLSEDYAPKAEITVTEYFATPTHSPRFVDYTDPKVTEEFIRNTYEGYAEAVGDMFGDTIPLIFTDEPGLKQFTLPKNLFGMFAERYGYDLADYIYVLGERGAKTDREMQARIDYAKLTGELFLKNTFDKLADWCLKHGIAYAGHLMADNYPDSYRCGYLSQIDILRRMHIPGVDAIWEQIRYPYGGREPFDAVETARMPFFVRLAPSAARQMGRNISLTEAMGIYGDGITPNEIRYVTNYHVIRGINYISYAHIPFSGKRYSALATRPDFRPEKPGFFNLGQINEYFARISYLARLGYAEGDTALYHPCLDYTVGGELSDAAVENYRAAGVSLEQRCIAFDIIDDEGIRNSCDTGVGLALGDAVYSHFVVPENKFMPEDVRKKIAPYLGAGEPTYRFNNDKLRVMTRRLESGRLWFIFNEGEPTVTEELSIGDGKNIYRIDANVGEIHLEKSAAVSLECGDIAVFLVTDETLDAVSSERGQSTEICGFEPVGYKRLVITYDGLENEYGEGMLPDGASGEATYIAGYSLPSTPKAGERYKIRLEGFSLTASVKLGTTRLSFGTTPMERIIDGSQLEKNGQIEITVANTSLNEIHRQDGLRKYYPAEEVGPYLYRIEEFEKNEPLLKFGRVFIEKMK